MNYQLSWDESVQVDRFDRIKKEGPVRELFTFNSTKLCNNELNKLGIFDLNIRARYDLAGKFMNLEIELYIESNQTGNGKKILPTIDETIQQIANTNQVNCVALADTSHSSRSPFLFDKYWNSTEIGSMLTTNGRIFMKEFLSVDEN